MNATHTRVALYTRVSTDMQAHRDEGSLDTQEGRLRAYLDSRPGHHEVVQVFREEGASGKSLDRPELQRMLHAVRRGQVDLVLVTRLDRLSRSLLDFFELHRAFEERSVQFVSLNETFDTSSPVGRAMLKLVLVFAELEREQTADRTRVAMKARAARGLWNGGHPPLGYDSESKGHLTVNQREAELVRLIFDKYVEMRSTVKVTRWLNDQGHRRKRYHSRRKGDTGDKLFTVAVVRGMLKNRLYLGEINHKGEVYEGQHDAVLQPEVFERTQAIMAGNSKNRRGPPLRSKHDYPLSGLLTCACGYSLTTSAGTGRKGKVYHYYRCVGLQKKGRHDCDVRQVRAETIEPAVFSVIREAGRDPELLAAAVEEANRLAREQVDPLQRRVESLRAELSQVEEEGRRVLGQVLNAGVSDSDFARSLLREIEVRRNGLRTALAREEGELAMKQTEQLDMELVLQALRGFDAAFEHLTAAEKREFLALMIHDVQVHTDHVDVLLYDGRQARTRLDQITRGGGPGGGRSGGRTSTSSQKDGTPPDVQEGFVAVSNWLPPLLLTATNLRRLAHRR